MRGKVVNITPVNVTVKQHDYGLHNTGSVGWVQSSASGKLDGVSHVGNSERSCDFPLGTLIRG